MIQRCYKTHRRDPQTLTKFDAVSISQLLLLAYTKWISSQYPNVTRGEPRERERNLEVSLLVHYNLSTNAYPAYIFPLSCTNLVLRLPWIKIWGIARKTPWQWYWYEKCLSENPCVCVWKGTKRECNRVNKEN